MQFETMLNFVFKSGESQNEMNLQFRMEGEKQKQNEKKKLNRCAR